MTCYMELSTCRQVGMSAGRIPLTAIQAYADRHELGELFIQQILRIDQDVMVRQSKDQANGN